MVVTEADGIKPGIARPDCWSYPRSAEGISRHQSVASLTLVRCRLKRVQNGKVFKKRRNIFALLRFCRIFVIPKRELGQNSSLAQLVRAPDC